MSGAPGNLLAEGSLLSPGGRNHSLSILGSELGMSPILGQCSLGELCAQLSHFAP